MSANQCMGCQAGWSKTNNIHSVQGGYKHEVVMCTADRYKEVPSGFDSMLTVYYKNGHEVKTPSKRPYIERLALLDPFKYHDAIPLSEVGKYLG